MNKIVPRQKMIDFFSRRKNVAFVYIFGSSARQDAIHTGSDLDLAVYFDEHPDPDGFYDFITELEESIEIVDLDILVLNRCEDFILRNEVLKGELLFRRDIARHAAFFSWTLRMYEDEMVRSRRAFG